MPITINGSGTITGASSFPTNTAFGGTLSTASRGISNASLPSGSIVQVQSFYNTDAWSSAAGVYPGVTTGFSLNITPTSSTSKILMIGSLYASVSNGGIVADFYFKRGTTPIGIGVGFGNDTASPGFFVNAGTDKPWITLPIYNLDSPATTSTLTYTLWAQCGNGGTAYLNRRADNWSTGSTQFSLLEIAQ